MSASRLPLACLAVVAAAVAEPATAQDDAPAMPPPPAAAAPAPPANTVEGVTVIARRPTTVTGVTVVAQGWCPRPDPSRYPAAHDPMVVDSYPAAGSTVPPGAVSVRFSFDAAMSCGWALDIDGGLNDPCAKGGAWALPGRRTFITRCVLEPSAHYVFHFRRDEVHGFVGLSGRHAQGFDLAFDTSDAPPRSATSASLDLKPTGAEPAKAYVTCLDRGPDVAGSAGACQRALIDPDAPPAP